jgi:ABC-type Fe3+-hydroxamate transport system substrate-binding protein
MGKQILYPAGQSILPLQPQRIVSLVPSQTELLFDLGLGEEVIGITKFCIHPNKWFTTKTRIGGTKTVDVEKVRSLNPDLIIANKEENVKEQIEALSQFAPVYVSDINDLESAVEMIKDVGNLVGKEDESLEIINQIKTGFTQLTNKPINGLTDQPIKTAYLIWKEPYMAAGGDTFINDMLERCGFDNVFKTTNRYPEVSIEQLKGCELILLSSEPYPFKQNHIEELQQRLPSTKIWLVDGEMFSWYGSRLIKTAPYLNHLCKQIHQLYLKN